MSTMIANGAVVVWAVALIFAPGLLHATFWRSTPLTMAGGAMLTMAVVAMVTCLVSAGGYSPVPWLRALAAVLVLAIVTAVVRVAMAARRRPGARRIRTATPLGAAAIVVAVGLLGLWTLAPLAVVLQRHGVEFGLLTHGNADESNYVFAAQNMTATGFQDSHRLANADFGQVSRTNYVGAITMLVWLSAITPLGSAQVALACLAVATCLAAVCLWALATQVWPTLAPVVALPGVLIVSASGFAAYSFASYFLGAELGLATAAGVVAGTVSLSRRWSWMAATATAASGGYGVYAYGHIGLLVLVLALPLAAVVAMISSGFREVPRAAARTALACVAGTVVALPTVSEAYALVRAQSGAQAGWSLPPVNPFRALFWPQGIGLPSSGVAVAIAWVIVLGALLVAIVIAARQPTQRRSAVLAGAVLLGVVVVVFGAAWVYGAERYQSWKMLQLLLPVGLVVALPAVSLVVIRGSRVGTGVLIALSGVALLGPWLMWQDVLAAPDTAILTSADLVDSTRSIHDHDIAAVNVRLPEGNPTMMAGAMLSDTAVVLSSTTYYPALASGQTCTLTLRSMLAPEERDFIPLTGDYVLVERPSACLVGR